MTLTKKHLKNNFERAKETNSPFVFVAIVAEGVEELILIPERSFEAKEKFYLGAYSDDLTHVMNKSVYIRGLSYGDIDDSSNIKNKSIEKGGYLNERYR